MTQYSSVGKSNYLSLEDILATQTRVLCKFVVQVKRLGYLDPSSGSEHIASGTKQELPFWLARVLCGKSRRIVGIEMPTAYKRSYRDVLSADATVVDLHKLGPYFYNFGLHVLEFHHPDGDEVGRSLVETFQDRFRSIMDSSLNSLNENVVQLTAGLDELERALFHTGQKCLMDFQQWQTCQTDKIQTSTMVSNHKKRKREEDA